MAGLFCTLPLMHPKPSAASASASKPTSFVSVIEDEENFFEGILTGKIHGMQNSSKISHHHQLPCSSPNPNISTIHFASTSNNTLPVKNLLPSQYWDEAAPAGSSPMAASSGKRFHGDLNSCSTATDQDNTSFVSLLSQLPQSTPFHPNTFLGSLGDGVLRQQFQLPSMNWNS